MEQTSVEFLVDKMLYIENEYDMKLINKSEYQAKRRDIIDQAKEIEKQQIVDAYRMGRYDGDKIVMSKKFYAEQYYNETFKNK